MSATSDRSSAAAHSWHLAAVCLFWERFILHFPAAPHFNPQLLLQSLQCSSHQATSAKVWPFQRRAKAVTEAIVERKQADEESEQAEAEAEAEAEGGSLPGVASHDADLCRCYHGACMHAIQLHIALLTAAGYGNVTVESWQKHVHGELDARPEDWPALQSILDREEQQRREAEEDDVPLVTTKNKKRKAVSSLASAVDDTHNPLYALHYHALSAEVKAALLYLHTCWMLHDDNIHAAVAEGAMRDTAEAAYGRDDANRRYWLFTHCEWGESRVHLYRETDAAAEEEYGWELLASNRDQLEEALALLQVQSSDNSRTLAYRIQYEALEFMDREGRLAERRQRRATRMELDLHNIIGADAVGDSGLGRARRARKQINYAEMEAGDVDRMAEEDERAAKESASELAERRRNGRGRRGQPVAQAALEAEQDQKWREEDEEELYAAKVMHAQQVSGEAEEHEQPTAQQQPAAEEPQTERSVEEQLWESALTNDQQPELDTVQTAHTQNGDSHLQPAAGGQTERQEADRYQLDATGSGDKIFGGPVSASADNNGLVPSPADAAPPPS